jgi:hypothetical protein
MKIKCFLLFFIISCSLLSNCINPDSSFPNRTDYDPDLDGWRTASWSPFTTNDTITDFAYGNGRYAAVSASGIIAWSEDGDIWKRAAITPNDSVISINAVYHANGIFIAVANNGKIVRSTNGVNWTVDTLTSEQGGGFTENEAIRSIAWGAGNFIVVGDNAKIFYSNNGITWRNGPNTGFPSHVYLNDVAFEPTYSMFFTVGNDGSWGWINTATLDSFSRYNPPNPRPITTEIMKVTTGRLGNNSCIGFIYYFYIDGKWVKRAVIAAVDQFFDFHNQPDRNKFQWEPFLFNNNHMNVLTWAGDYFVTAGENAMIGYLPGTTEEFDRFWRALPFTEFRNSDITALAACNGRFFIGNDSGKIGYSK